MRINVYSQELTSEVTLVSKTTGKGVVHYGVRLFFAGSALLHKTPDDDDRSAITFWLPNCGNFTKYDLEQVLYRASVLAAQAPVFLKEQPCQTH